MLRLENFRILNGQESGCRSQGPFKTVARYAAYQCEAVCGVCPTGGVAVEAIVGLA